MNKLYTTAFFPLFRKADGAEKRCAKIFDGRNSESCRRRIPRVYIGNESRRRFADSRHARAGFLIFQFFNKPILSSSSKSSKSIALSKTAFNLPKPAGLCMSPPQ